jgi:hypothetical protein
MSRFLTSAALGLLAVLALPAHAADTCDLGDTIDQCWQRISGAPDQKIAAERMQEDVKKEETGLDGGAAALATTTRNLLPFLAASGLISDSDGDSEDQLFTLDLNFLIRGIAKDNNAQLKAILNTKPTLFDEVKTAFDGATGDDTRSAELQDGLSAADDYTFSFTYNHISDRFGRAPQQQQARFARLFDAAITAATAEEPRGAAGDATLAMAKVLQRLGVEDADFIITDEATLDAVENAAKLEMSLGNRTRGKLMTFQLPRFAELVNNQPQLAFTAELHDRDPLVGAKEKAIKFTYEFGFASVNDFVEEGGAQCGISRGGLAALASVDANACLTAYSRYISTHDKALANADRFSIELSYVEVEDYEFASEDDDIALARDGTRHLDIAVGYGRTMQALGADRDSRVDFVARYEDYSDDVEHQDRMVATLTFTTQFNGVAIPFSLVYANHQKFLPDSDDTLGAHIGIKYQFDPKD